MVVVSWAGFGNQATTWGETNNEGAPRTAQTLLSEYAILLEDNTGIESRRMDGEVVDKEAEHKF